jgi:hypothetical protein
LNNEEGVESGKQEMRKKRFDCDWFVFLPLFLLS